MTVSYKFVLFLSVLVVSSCSNEVDYDKLAKANVNQIIKKADGHVMVYQSIPNFNQMDSSTYNTIWENLAQKSADLEYNSRSAYIFAPDCIKFPREFSLESPEYVKAIQDSFYFTTLKDKVIYLRDFTNFDSITYLNVLLYNERLSHLSQELENFCKK